MSAITKSRGTATPGEICVCYDFEQVSDAVLLTFHKKEYSGTEEILLYKTADGWDLNELENMLDKETFAAICDKLSLVFNQRSKSDKN